MNRLFNGVPRENEEWVFYFYLSTNELFGQCSKPPKFWVFSSKSILLICTYNKWIFHLKKMVTCCDVCSNNIFLCFLRKRCFHNPLPEHFLGPSPLVHCLCWATCHLTCLFDISLSAYKKPFKQSFNQIKILEENAIGTFVRARVGNIKRKLLMLSILLRLIHGEKRFLVYCLHLNSKSM